MGGASGGSGGSVASGWPAFPAAAQHLDSSGAVSAAGGRPSAHLLCLHRVPQIAQIPGRGAGSARVARRSCRAAGSRGSTSGARRWAASPDPRQWPGRCRQAQALASARAWGSPGRPVPRPVPRRQVRPRAQGQVSPRRAQGQVSPRVQGQVRRQLRPVRSQGRGPAQPPVPRQVQPRVRRWVRAPRQVQPQALRPVQPRVPGRVREREQAPGQVREWEAPGLRAPRVQRRASRVRTAPGRRAR